MVYEYSPQAVVVCMGAVEAIFHCDHRLIPIILTGTEFSHRRTTEMPLRISGAATQILDAYTKHHLSQSQKRIDKQIPSFGHNEKSTLTLCPVY